MEQKSSPTERDLKKTRVPTLKGVQFIGSDSSSSSKAIESPHPAKPRRGSDIVHITSVNSAKQSIEELIRSSLSDAIRLIMSNKLESALKKQKQKPIYNLEDRDHIVNLFIAKMEANFKKNLITRKQFDLLITDKKETLSKLLGGAFGLGMQRSLDFFYSSYDPKQKKSKHDFALDCLKSNESQENINHLVVALLSPSKDIQDLINLFQSDNFIESLKHGDFERATVTQLKEKCNDRITENDVIFFKVNEWIFKNFRLIYLVDYAKLSHNLENVCDLLSASYDGERVESITINSILFNELTSINKQIAAYFKDKIEQRMIYWESPRALESPRSGSSTSSSQIDSPRSMESPRNRTAPEGQEYSRVLKLLYSKLTAIINPASDLQSRSKLTRSLSQGSTSKTHSTTSLSTSQSAPGIAIRNPLELSAAIRMRDLSLNEPESTRSIIFGSPK